MITQINVKRGLIVYSSDPAQWIAGQRIPLRVEARSLPFRQTIRLEKVTVKVTPSDARKRPVRDIKYSLSAAIDQMWQGEFKLPEAPGKYRLLIEAKGYEHASVTKGKTSDLPVDLNAHLDITLRGDEATPLLWPPLAQTPTTASARQGPGTISFYPADQRLTSELPSKLFVVAQDESDAPWQGELSIAQMEGLIAGTIPTRIKTSREGIAGGHPGQCR